MPGKNASALILDALHDLIDDQFSLFRHKLIYSEQEREERRFKASEVHGKSRVEITEVLVSRCSSEAVDRTIVILKEIGCNREAERLAAKAADLPQTAKAADLPRTAGASGAPARQGGHFVDRHQIELIKRVANIKPILDYLLRENVLRPEQYDEARVIPTKQDQMRFLYRGPLTAGGDRSKDVLLSVLEKEEPFLIQDLRESEG